MGVRFVIGRAGSGKSRRCLDLIEGELRARPMGTPIFWILPRQATFQAERELLCRPGLGGYVRARVTSFDHLGQMLLDGSASGATQQVTRLGRQMVLGHLLRMHEGELKHFQSVARQPGLAAQLDATFAEFERSGKGAGDLQQVLDGLGDDGRDFSPELPAKVRDLHLIHQAYTSYLGQERIDPRRRMDRVLESIASCEHLREADVYVDGFNTFTDYERRVLVGMAKCCRRIEVTVLMDPDSPVAADVHRLPEELGLFHQTERMFRSLWFAMSSAGVPMEEMVRLRAPRRFEEEVLGRIERAWDQGESGARSPTTLSGGKTPSPALPGDTGGGGQRHSTGGANATLSATLVHSPHKDAVALVEAADRRLEVDAAARRVLEWVHQGMRLREIAIITRRLEDYQELIDASFAEHGIAFFVDRRRTAMHHPLLQFIRAVFEIVMKNWPHEAAMALLKSGLGGVSQNEADEIENYVLLHGIRGAAWASDAPWTYVRSIRRREDEDPAVASQKAAAARVDGLRRRVVDAMTPFINAVAAARAMTVREVVEALFALFERMEVRRTLSEWMRSAEEAGEFETRAEHEQVWVEAVALFEQMVDLLGTEAMGLEDFVTVLETGLEQFDLALTPPTLDQVLVGQVDRTRATGIRGVIVLGMNEGEFPRLPREDTILNDRDRQALEERQMRIDPETERRLLDENLLGYLAMTLGSQKLCVMRATSDDRGRPTAPSAFWSRLRGIVPEAPIDAIPRGAGRLAKNVGTPRQLVTGLMNWVRDEGMNASGASDDDERGAWRALYQWFAKRPHDEEAVDQIRNQAWGALSYRNEASLSSGTTGELFASPLTASASQVETFATCPFKHFARYGLSLREREEQEVTRLDLSRLYHDILARLVREMLLQRKDWSELPVEVTDELIVRYARDVGEALKNELMLSSARNQYLLTRIEKTLEEVVAHQRAAAARGTFRPAFVDVQFGLDKRLASYRLTTPGGRELLLEGKIDRVDTTARDGAFAILDYTLSGSSLSLERVYHGISLQLLTYLLVMQANGKNLVGKELTPAAAFYLQLLRKIEKVNHPSESLAPDDPNFELRVKPRGLFDARYLPSLDSELTSGASDVVSAYVTKDGRLGRLASTDAGDAEAFVGLMRHVEATLGQLGDQMLSGDISVHPYRLGKMTPCEHCEFRAVCRFDAAINNYHFLKKMRRDEVLDEVRAKGDDDES